jgi:uncharacterized protein YcbK (DUF882 family)
MRRSLPPAPSSAAEPVERVSASRRQALRLLAGGTFAAAVCGAAPRRAWADASGTASASAEAARAGTRRLTFHNTHTGESLAVDYCLDGRYCSEGLARVNHVLRDHRNGAVHPIDPQLLDLLHDVAQRCDRDPEFDVISGYRSPASNAMLHARSSGVATRSLHMDGRAIDVRLVGYDLARLRDRALDLQRGGVGYYRASQFVHLDTGRVRHWTG